MANCDILKKHSFRLLRERGNGGSVMITTNEEFLSKCMSAAVSSGDCTQAEVILHSLHCISSGHVQE